MVSWELLVECEKSFVIGMLWWCFVVGLLVGVTYVRHGVAWCAPMLAWSRDGFC